MRQLLDKLQALLGVRARNGNKDQRKRRQPSLEFLEDRNLLAGDTALGSLSGASFFDFNGNGKRDTNEAAAPGIVVTLQGQTTAGAAVNASTTTNALGGYQFTKIAAGAYQISTSSPGTFIAGTGVAGSLGGVGTTNAVTQLFIDAGQALTDYNLPVSGLAAGLVSLRLCLNNFDPQTSLPLGPGGSGTINADGSSVVTSARGNLTLAGSVFGDTNADRAFGAGETGFANVRIALTGVETSNGAPIVAFANTTTNGTYSFSGLNPGKYNLNVVQSPVGFRSGVPTLGSANGTIRRNDQIVDITLGTGQSGTGYLFGQLTGVSPPTNTTVPTVVAQLASDTASAPGTVNDNITTDPSVYGFISNVDLLGDFRASLGNGAEQSILGSVDGTGRFYLNISQLATLNGGTLPDAAYVLHLKAFNLGGTATSTVDLNFTLNRNTPSTPVGMSLDSLFDNGSNPADNRTTLATVSIIGQASANTTVVLLKNNVVVQTVNTGNSTQFRFDLVNLDAGNNTFTFRSTNLAGNTSPDATATFYRDVAPTVDNTANATFSASQSAANSLIELNTFFDDADLTDSFITFKTNKGDINIELFDRAAPGTVANFLNYITSDRFDSSVFNRLASGFVLQGGGQVYNNTTHTLTSITTDPAIKNEADAVNRSNILGTLSMAKVDPSNGGGPDSATSAFFINLANNASNLDNQNGGFTVFGKLATSADLTLVNQLTANVSASSPSLGNGLGIFPTYNYSGNNFPSDTTSDNLLVINDVVIAQQNEKLTFSIVSNDRPDLVTASIANNNRVSLDYQNAGTGTATIVIRATDKDGLTVDRSFTINVTA